MRTVIPGTVSTLYLNELQHLQREFLDSITEAPTETAAREASYQAWLKSTGPKRVNEPNS